MARAWPRPFGSRASLRRHVSIQKPSHLGGSLRTGSTAHGHSSLQCRAADLSRMPAHVQAWSLVCTRDCAMSISDVF